MREREARDPLAVPPPFDEAVATAAFMPPLPVFEEPVPTYECHMDDPPFSPPPPYPGQNVPANTCVVLIQPFGLTLPANPPGPTRPPMQAWAAPPPAAVMATVRG